MVLKCYPVAALEEFGNPTEFLQRETKALNKLAELGRAWQALPFFRDDAYGLFVVPVVRPPNARSLVKSLKELDPVRPGGRLPDDVARNVVFDAYTALAEVHEEKLVHRALDPSRIWLGRSLRVMFSDFHLARIEGAQTIAAWEPDEDSSDDYRAPECAVSVATATPKSDVFSLTLCLIEWLLGEPAPEFSAEELWARLVEAFPWAEPMGGCAGGSWIAPERRGVGTQPETEVGLGCRCAGARRTGRLHTGRSYRGPLSHRGNARRGRIRRHLEGVRHAAWPLQGAQAVQTVGAGGAQGGVPDSEPAEP